MGLLLLLPAAVCTGAAVMLWRMHPIQAGAFFVFGICVFAALICYLWTIWEVFFAH